MGVKNVKMKYNKSYTTHLSLHGRALYDSEVNEVLVLFDNIHQSWSLF